ncbi:hypothetical protein D5S18_21910 [Nocardia panacis]|uniref:Uncharacterized protein n=1 Tax=Nocardia panacis TaxID=2340916 RepID=A0A3A4KCJ5_9NOCA|nr:hypothetical protein D5S18_21910 [Nocardia panacis]
MIHDAVRAAESRSDWGAAISVVSAAARCRSADADMHNAHLWHMDLLVKAELIDELAMLARADVHARRRLDRFLYENGCDGDLRQRAQRGDKAALYYLVKLLRRRGEQIAAQQVVDEIDPADQYALELATRDSS